MHLPTLRIAQFRGCTGIAPCFRYDERSYVVQPFIIMSDNSRPYATPIDSVQFDSEHVSIGMVSFPEFAHILSEIAHPSNTCNTFESVHYLIDKIMHHALDLIKEKACQIDPHEALKIIDSLPDIGLNIADEWFNNALKDLRTSIVEAIKDPMHPMCQMRIMHDFANLSF